MATTAKQRAQEEFLTPASVINEAALQEAYRVGEIHDEETRFIVRCAVLAYEVAKEQHAPKHQ
jgi:hypothetical protein